MYAYRVLQHEAHRLPIERPQLNYELVWLQSTYSKHSRLQISLATYNWLDLNNSDTVAQTHKFQSLESVQSLHKLIKQKVLVCLLSFSLFTIPGCVQCGTPLHLKAARFTSVEVHSPERDFTIVRNSIQLKLQHWTTERAPFMHQNGRKTENKTAQLRAQCSTYIKIAASVAKHLLSSS